MKESGPQYSISVLIYGRSPSAETDNVSTHVGIALHEDIAQPIDCSLHHARCPDQVRFIYEHRLAQPYASDYFLRGRCELATGLAPADVAVCETIFANHGAEMKHLPLYGEGNCQTWLADMIQILERESMLTNGDAEFWKGMVHRGRVDVVKAWECKGRVWIDNPASFDFKGEPDARWAKSEEVVGLEKGEIGKRGAALKGLLWGQK